MRFIGTEVVWGIHTIVVLPTQFQIFTVLTFTGVESRYCRFCLDLCQAGRATLSSVHERNRAIEIGQAFTSYLQCVNIDELGASPHTLILWSTIGTTDSLPGSIEVRTGENIEVPGNVGTIFCKRH